MDEATFDKLAERELEYLEGRLAGLPEVEVDSTGDVLTVEFEDGSRYVINSHRAARQVWLSAELRASHYTLAEATSRWLDDKTGEDLHARLDAVLTARLGRQVHLFGPRS
jgi:CyaY protein